MKIKFDTFFEQTNNVETVHPKILVEKWYGSRDNIERQIKYLFKNTSVKQLYIKLLIKIRDNIIIDNNITNKYIGTQEVIEDDTIGDLYSTNIDGVYSFTTGPDTWIDIKIAPDYPFVPGYSRVIEDVDLVISKIDVLDYEKAFNKGDFEQGVDLASDLF